MRLIYYVNQVDLSEVETPKCQNVHHATPIAQFFLRFKTLKISFGGKLYRVHNNHVGSLYANFRISTYESLSFS